MKATLRLRRAFAAVTTIWLVLLLVTPAARADCSICTASTSVASSQPPCGSYVWNLYITTTTDGQASYGTMPGTGACTGDYLDCNGNYVSPGSKPATINATQVPDDTYGTCTGTFTVTNYQTPQRHQCPPDSQYPNGTIEDPPPSSQ